MTTADRHNVQVYRTQSFELNQINYESRVYWSGGNDFGDPRELPGMLSYQTDMLSYQTDILSYQIDMFVISILISFAFTFFASYKQINIENP